VAKLIGIYGEPGTGKSTSLRNLPPSETLYIDADMKGLNWKGWKKEYNGDNKNYLKTNFPQLAIKYLQLAEKGTYKYVVIDTVNNLMVSDEMRRCKEKGYDKWMDLAACIWELVDLPGSLRDDLTVILLFHSQTDYTEDGYRFTKIKTNGRKTEKNNIDSKFNWLLRTVKQDDGKYYFETTAHNSTTRTPLDAFEDDYIPNDIMKVIEVMEEY
jgi:hypothetical protein